jgi:hypothetical protein
MWIRIRIRIRNTGKQDKNEDLVRNEQETSSTKLLITLIGGCAVILQSQYI